MKKLKAFTLLELLIGMVVSGLVVTFCLLGYFIVNKQFSNYRKVKQETSTVATLCNVMSNDFQSSKRILKNSETEFACEFNEKQILYKLDKGLVLRNDLNIIDTFQVATQNVQFVSLESRYEGTLKLISKISFEAMLLNEYEPFNFVKNYDAATLINDSVEN